MSLGKGKDSKALEYDVIAIGSGSAMNIIQALLNNQKDLRVAIIEKDEPGGICLTRGCIPTKLLVYPAELVRLFQEAERFGIHAPIKKVDFQKVMNRMRDHVKPQIEAIRRGLSNSKDLDYYPEAAEFIAPYTLKVGERLIKSDFILLCTGSEVSIPPIKGLDEIGYHTSDTILEISTLPESLIIVGGGYIAAEYGHFFSAMGSKVTILGRNPQFLPQEEPEISRLAKQEMGRHMKVVTNHEVVEAQKSMGGKKKLIARDRKTGKSYAYTAQEVLIATGRSPNSNILHPERTGVEVNEGGWIKVNQFMETTKKGIWAFGDATGQHLFKHVANYESEIVYYNAVLKKRVPVDYHAVPHAVFSHPEIAGVGLTQAQAIRHYGKENIAIGFQKYQDTAKGSAMGVERYFVKVIVEAKTRRILGAHIIGPQASVLIQEIINLMNTKDQSLIPLNRSMHIHPGLSEVVERACTGFMPVDHYNHLLLHEQGIAHEEKGHHHH